MEKEKTKKEDIYSCLAKLTAVAQTIVDPKKKRFIESEIAKLRAQTAEEHPRLWFLGMHKHRYDELLDLAQHVNGEHQIAPALWLEDTLFCLNDPDSPLQAKDVLYAWIEELQLQQKGAQHDQRR